MRTILILFLLTTTAEAQELITPKTHQLSLVGLRERQEGDQATFAVVTSDRTVIRAYRAQAKEIQQMRLAVGKCGCGG